MMANALVVCMDKTRTPTQYKITIIVAGSVGIYAKFVWRLDENLTSDR